MKTVLPLLIEYIGTYIFTLLVLASSNIVLISLVFFILLFITVPISGGCLNPAITWVMYLNNRLGLYETGLYITLQMLGAITAFYVFKILE
jgi:glycerol uptake facilitator-like aquaporin